MTYGIAPEVVGEFVTPDCELTYTLYMPISLSGGPVTIPKHLAEYEPLVWSALNHEGDRANGKYVYLTVKRLWVEPGCIGGRPGWHTDGFGTDDVNYIWCDFDPTEFCVQPFDLSDDHEVSMRQMEEQARQDNIRTYGALNILRLDARHVHRCPVNVTPGYRTFARVSISADRYDMIGNARNHDLDYNWIMYPRGTVRNDVSARKSA
jgi:hypothetical protein